VGGGGGEGKVRCGGGSERQRRERVGGGEGRLGLGNVCIYTCFFFKCWLIEPVRFNRFQTLEAETEPNRNFFVIF